MAKVIDFFAERRKRVIKEKVDLLKKAQPEGTNVDEQLQETADQSESTQSETFEEIQKQNKLKQAKLEKMRLDLNDKVKRSYNLTPNKPKPKK